MAGKSPVEKLNPMASLGYFPIFSSYIATFDDRGYPIFKHKKALPP
jgi:hypothetical protein